MVKIVNDYVYKKWDNLKLNDEINFSDKLQVMEEKEMKKENIYKFLIVI